MRSPFHAENVASVVIDVVADAERQSRADDLIVGMINVVDHVTGGVHKWRAEWARDKSRARARIGIR